MPGARPANAPATPENSPIEAEPVSLPRRILAVFAAPGELFESFRHSAPWFGPMAISTLVVMFAMATLPSEVFLAQTENAVDRRGDPVEITSDAAEIATYGRMMSVLGVAVANPTAAFAVAGILTLVFSMIGGGAASYREYLAATTHSLLVVSLGMLIGIILQIVGFPSTTLLLALLEPFIQLDGTLQAILENLNFFLLWMILLLGLAVSKLDGRRTWVSSAATIFGLYLAFIITTAFVVG